MGFFDFGDDLADGEGFFEEAVESLGAESHGLSVGELAGHGDDAGDGEFVGGAEELGDVVGGAGVSCDVEVEEEDMGPEAFALESGLEAGGCGVDLVVGLFGEDIGEGGGDFLVFVDDEDAWFARVHAVEGDVVVFHELDELGDGDASVL